MVTRTLVSAVEPFFVDPEHTMIHLDVVFEEIADLGVIPFVATATDPYPHGVDAYNRAMAGEFGPIFPYKGPKEFDRGPYQYPGHKYPQPPRPQHVSARELRYGPQPQPVAKDDQAK